MQILRQNGDIVICSVQEYNELSNNKKTKLSGKIGRPKGSKNKPKTKTKRARVQTSNSNQRWHDSEILYLKRNQHVGIKAKAKFLGRSIRSVDTRISLLKKKGEY